MNGDLASEVAKWVIGLILGGGGFKLWADFRAARREKRLEPVNQGKAINELADALTETAHKSVSYMRAELEDARRELAEARQDLSDKAALMEQRETEHRQRERESLNLIERLQRRVAQLVATLGLHQIDVPDELPDQ